MAITIKDIAKAVGVSPSTVSRTCNDHPGISEKTKNKIRKAMEELGYVPNFQAKNLVNRSSNTIGIVLPMTEQHTYQNTFYLEVIHGISQCCNQNKYMNTIITGNSENELFENVLSGINSGKIDAFILLYSKKDDKIIKYLDDNSFPYILIGKPMYNIEKTSFVDNDNILAGKDATNYLIKLGHRRIMFFYNKSSYVFEQDRKIGYMAGLVENGIEYDSKLVVEGDKIKDKEMKYFKKIFSGNNIPTAIITTDDISALKIEKILLSLNFNIPSDVSIIAFNNSLISNLTSPRLTVIDINNYQLGYQASEQIIFHLLQKSSTATKVIVSHSLVERESCKKIFD